MKTWAEMSWWERIRLLLFSIAPALVLLVAAEFYAGAVIHRDFSIETDPITGDSAVYRMHFGRYGWGQETFTPLNAMGLPDDEYAAIGPKGDCVHIVFVGDSFTFGDAVDRHRNWVSLVKRAIGRRHPGRCIRVFNVGQRMTTIEEQARLLRATREALRPDVVIFGMYQNDLTDLANPGNAAYEPPKAEGETRWWGSVTNSRVPFANAALIRWLSYHAFAYIITHDKRYDVLGQWSVLVDERNQPMADKLTRIYREQFAAIVGELRALGAEVGAVVMPSKLDLLAGRSPEEPFFVETARAEGVPVIATYAALDRSRRDYPYQMYDGHLSPSGNAVVAREVLDWLGVDTDDSPFRALRRPAGPR